MSFLPEFNNYVPVWDCYNVFKGYDYPYEHYFVHNCMNGSIEAYCNLCNVQVIHIICM